MEQNGIKFTLVDTKKVRVSGFPELEGKAAIEGKVWLCSGENNGVIMSCLSSTPTLAKFGNCLRKKGPCWWMTVRLIEEKCGHGHRNAKDKILSYKGDLILRME